MTPVLRCDWYLMDIGRSISEFSRAFLVHCLNPTFHTNSAIRSKTLIRILSATAPLRVRPAYRPLIGDLLEYFLQLRLEAGLNLEWDAVDDFLAEAFKTEVETPILQELIFSATHRLQMYHWGPENKKLYVSPLILLMNLLHLLDRIYCGHTCGAFFQGSVKTCFQ